MPLPVGTAADEIAAVLHPARVGTRRLTGPAGVVVVHEGDRALGPPADQPRRLAVRVPQAPELVFGNRLLQHRLGGKIKRRRGRCPASRTCSAASGSDPTRAVRRAPSSPRAKTRRRSSPPPPRCCPRTPSRRKRRIFSVIEPPPDEPDGVFEPVEPRGELAPRGRWRGPGPARAGTTRPCRCYPRRETRDRP